MTIVWVLLGVGVALMVVAGVGCWLLDAGARRTERARRALAEDRPIRERVGL
jgi:hypothetical protein